MHVESLDLIVSVHGSRNDYYKPEKEDECRITYGKRHVLKTPKNSEFERRFAPNCVGYTACLFVAFHDTTVDIFSFSGGVHL